MISSWTTFRNDKNGHCTQKNIAAFLISIAVRWKKYKLKQERRKGKLCLKLI